MAATNNRKRDKKKEKKRLEREQEQNSIASSSTSLAQAGKVEILVQFVDPDITFTEAVDGDLPASEAFEHCWSRAQTYYSSCGLPKSSLFALKEPLPIERLKVCEWASRASPNPPIVQVSAEHGQGMFGKAACLSELLGSHLQRKDKEQQTDPTETSEMLKRMREMENKMQGMKNQMQEMKTRLDNLDKLQAILLRKMIDLCRKKLKNLTEFAGATKQDWNTLISHPGNVAAAVNAGLTEEGLKFTRYGEGSMQAAGNAAVHEESTLDPFVFAPIVTRERGESRGALWAVFTYLYEQDPVDFL